MAKKKRYYKRKHGNKGVRYIAQRLKKYYKGRYPTYQSALPRAREIHADLKSKKQKVILSNIFPYERRTRTQTRRTDEYTISEELLTDIHYFQLENYPEWIARCSNNLYFVSDLFPSNAEQPVQGGDLPSYQTYFAAFVSYCNYSKGKLESDGDDDLYRTQWMVRCREPEPDGKGGFIVRIVSTDIEGNEINYGFDPNDPDFRPEDEDIVVLDIEEERPEHQEELPETKETPPADHKTQEDVEFIKSQENIKRMELMGQYAQMYQDGLITKAEWKELMGRIK